MATFLHDFPFINIRKVPREGPLRMLMNDKIMFDLGCGQVHII